MDDITTADSMKCKNCGQESNSLTDGWCQRCHDMLKITRRPFCFDVSPTVHEVGWVCPKCGGVMAPHQNFCVRCTTFDMTVTCSSQGGHT